MIGADNYTGSEVYVFARTGSTWAEQNKLTPGERGTLDGFGDSIALSGETAIVGTRGAAGAYVFVRSGSKWNQQAKLTPSTLADVDVFGAAVAVSGTFAIVGAPGATAATRAAYVFARTGSQWVQQSKLTTPDETAGDGFGFSVAISSTTAELLIPDRSMNSCAVVDGGTEVVAEAAVAVWAAREPLDDAPGDREADGGGRVRDVSFRPRGGSYECHLSVRPRGENAASVR